MAALTVANLVDYLLNNDLEAEIIRGDINTIADYIAKDFPADVVPFSTIQEALAEAQADPYIEELARRIHFSIRTK